ncbi:MATH domain and coiled-coil domain-containing protein At3g58360-like [Vicia villosa]|uniref:MATH domain and coiled-coil domain-containing protein At3g58360-like n=1 Tax=Vicia villosa TaxID=3911 RepID=UPI00273B2796|nr:MATH domain and coiled-coil domain-containing protein At3g58360-like [Vicia villosa]
MEQEEIFEKFTWKVENFSRLCEKFEYFVLGGYPWGPFHEGLGIFLEAVVTGNMSEGWNRDVKFKLLLFNQVNAKITVTKEFHHEFNEKEKVKGAFHFMTTREVRNPKKGFVVNNECIVVAEILVCKSTHEKRVYQTVNITSSLLLGSQIGHPEVESPVVSMEDTKNNDVEFVFSGLRRVLYFLQTRKVKDMNEHACKELRVLWDELKKFKFDVTWLMPHVHYALGMQRFAEKAMEVEKLNDTLLVLELETMRIKEKLVSAEMSLDVERQLLKAKDVEEIGLSYDLGCEKLVPLYGKGKSLTDTRIKSYLGMEIPPRPSGQRPQTVEEDEEELEGGEEEEEELEEGEDENEEEELLHHI